jgi:hypothetical protein
MEHSRDPDKENLEDDQFMEHLRFSSSFHPRPSYSSDKSDSSSSYHGRPTHHRGSKESYHRGSKESYHRGSKESYHRGSKESFGSTNHRDSKESVGSQSKRFAGGSNYNHNKKYSRTRNSQESDKRYSSDSRRETCDATCLTTSDNVLALFGAHGTTGQYVLQLALEAGYHVRVLVLPGVQLDMPESKNLTIVTGTFDEEHKIQRVIKKASYIVCMLNDCNKLMDEKEETVSGSSLGFIQRLVSVLEESRSNRVLLYQVRLTTRPK